ncbi:hypothetical protein E8E15_001837 [Penicillium rubens]|uniref:Pc18g02810 protein n=2 Tax=Penicillium chrysogenum species complex TaxID=254878 RepID=B6HB50_PENRW|nr:uncharacterized protein N7525_000709 [Penicillium rubens]KAJ5255397.1 hypothetical protein N7505_010548 [Penicillium chrysogenum]CAP94505.1 Pc18g02810 [Penicillium rubens Wisconsin 54-1255]KAF3012899.1 hypothetical protein E8E15_001837 [Penicillium rubens]KAJ5039568.1 hypothetical protein NUH16_009351 [Penicillium rubens]KAJ5842968.1 hypothetical protein N7525_000709 [Penicillium rubens]
MPPKKGQRKSMPARISKAPTLTPSRRSPRVPPPSKSTNENVQPAKTLNHTSSSPKDSPINIRFYTPNPPVPSNPSVSSTSSRGTSPETPSSRRRAFQSRPSRLSTVYTPALEAPATNQGSRRTRRTAALETPKKEVSDIDFPESTGTGSWTFDQYMGSFESEGTAEGPSSPTSASDMRNSSRVRKPTMRALESFESTKKKSRRKNTTVSTPTVETPPATTAAPAPSVATKVAKNNVSKQPMRKTRKSKRMSNLNMQKTAVLIGFDIDAKVAGQKLYDLSMQALSPDFTIPFDFPVFLEQQRSEYFRRQDEEKYGVDMPATMATTPTDVDMDVDMMDQDVPAPVIACSPSSSTPTAPMPATPPAAITNGATNEITNGITDRSSILSYKKQSDTKVGSDGWIQTGYVNSSGEEVTLIPEECHPYYPSHTYGYEGLPFPPVRARTTQQAEADAAHSFAPLMGGRNLPVEATVPFVAENVEEEKARALARTPVLAPATKKPRARKRRQTAAADATGEPAAATPATTTAETGARKSQRRRRQTAPAPTVPSPTSLTSPTSPPTTATQVQSSGPAAAVAPAATEGDKPKVQRLRLTLKPAPKTEASGAGASASKKGPAVQSPSSPALSRAPSSAPTNKRRRRRGM